MALGTSCSGRKLKPSFKLKANDLGKKSSKPVSKKGKKRASVNSPGSSTPLVTDHIPDSPIEDDHTPAMSSTSVQPTSDQPDVIDLEDMMNNTIDKHEDEQAKLG